MPAIRLPALAALAALLLAGCADMPAPQPPPPPVKEVASGTVVPDLVMHQWRALGRERAVVLALHGFGDAGELTYRDAAQYWAGRGITVYAPDQRGFGGNPSRRLWPGAEALAADAVTMAAGLRLRHPGVPLVVVGHSMGGGVALAAQAEGMGADALVLAAPAIAGGALLSPLYRLAGWSMARLAPDRRWTGGDLIVIHPSDNVEALRRVNRDPRHFANPSSRELYGLIHVLDRAARAAPSVTVPTLTLVGRKDALVRPAAVARVHERIPGAAGFIAYDEGWHWLFRDLQAANVWRDVADFVLSVPAPR